MEEQDHIVNGSEEFSSVDRYVSKTFKQKDVTTENGIKTIRANLNTDEDAHTWIREFGVETNTHWIVGNTYPSPERYLFRKRWVCHRNFRNKIAPGKIDKNEDCQAYIDIKIKKNTRYTRRNDPLLRDAIPLQGVIIMKLQHSHPIDDVPSYLKIDDDIRKMFEAAFENGISPSEAQAQHVSALRLRENATKIIADRRINPLMRSIRHIYDAWRKRKYGDRDKLLQQIKDRVEYHKNQGIDIVWTKGTDKEPWAILLVTPFMKENHSVRTCSDFVHVVTTTSGTAIQLTSPVTMLFGNSKTGPLPLAVLIHETQTILAFKAAFKLLKENWENCFGGKSFPEYFMTDNIPAQKKALNFFWPETNQLICHLRLLKAEWRYLTSFKMGVPVDRRKTYFTCFSRIMFADTQDTLSAAEFLFYDTVSHMGFRKRIQDLLSEKWREEWIQLYRSDSTKGRNINGFAMSVILAVKTFAPYRTKRFNPVELMDSAVIEWGTHVEEELGNTNCRLTKRDIWGEMPVDFDDEVLVDFKHCPVSFKREIRRKLPVRPEGHKDNFFLSNLSREEEPEYSGDEEGVMDTDIPNSDDDYNILANVENCGCPVSLRGEVCEHQIALRKQCGRSPSPWQYPEAIAFVAVDQQAPSTSSLAESNLVANGGASYTRQIKVEVKPVVDTQKPVTEDGPLRKEYKTALLKEMARMFDLVDSNVVENQSTTLDCLQEIRKREDTASPFAENILESTEASSTHEEYTSQIEVEIKPTVEHQAELQKQFSRSSSPWQDPEAITIVAVDEQAPLMPNLAGNNLVANDKASSTHEEYTSQIKVEVNPTVETPKLVTEDEPLRRKSKAALLKEMGRIFDLADSNVVENQSSATLECLQEIREGNDATSAFLDFTSSVKKRKIS